ncbi:penicillin-binding transpeptidase domain-containing protein [Clostridium pasteurianum]|uniref:Cell division protein FtsI/penicillin-binding protein 2 n=1 Tax=Clostridium pasteurianum BC1 TaxID=86416 RepID=R4K1S6_CLOPA|nr:penicillin-binding transpeptidase domain-containing protein [Clostridium pasteurianum]AGK97037.1 cell division protein FtsI/penicillin-binding protein 2 [Clostridium pasteurianum BC1]
MIKDKKKKKIFDRYTVLIVIMIIAFSAIGTQLFNLQVNMGTYYSETANTKSHKLIPQEGPRGTITDKNGINLATNIQSYEVTFMDTDDSEKQFFSTMSKIFKILDDNGEHQDDSFALKVNPFRFEFNASDPKSIQTLQLRFLKDRGFQDSILKTEFKGKKETDLTPAETSKLDSELLKLTPEQVFNTLIDDKHYGIVSGVSKLDSKYTVDELRRYLLVKDAIKMNSFSGYKPVPIASNIKKNTALILWQKLSDLSGINVDIQPMRSYPYGTLASSVLGYINKISSTDQEKYAEKGYDVSSDYVGASGIEAVLEDRLKGSNGGDIVQIDKQGRITNKLASREASPGENVQLTLDANVQYATEQALQNEMTYLQNKGQIQDQRTKNATRGAAVVIDVHTGAVLALASLPSFNPNDFSNPSGLTDDEIKKYFSPDYEQLAKAQGMPQDLIDYMFPIDSSIKNNTTIRTDRFDYFPKYLYNYATMSLLPPGSTFKPLTGVAGLQTGVIDANKTVNDQGYFVGDGGNVIEFRSDGPNGYVNIVKALEKSSNPYFMTVGKDLKNQKGEDVLAKYAWQFGLGADPNGGNASSGIEIPENFGQVYNTISQRNINSTQFLLNIEQYLNTGTDYYNDKLPQVDLYDRGNDSKKVSDIKTQIKNSIKNTIKNVDESRKFTQNNKPYITSLTNLFKQLSQETGKNLSDANINDIVNKVVIQQMGMAIEDLTPKYNYHIYNASIGQGIDNFTPVQMANYIATLANGGTRYKVHLVDKIKDADGKVVSETKPEVLNKVDMRPETRSLIMQGMSQVTGGAGGDGTASAALGGFNNYIPTAGKTGTAQVDTTVQAKTGRSDYGWFVGYAPANDPQIAISVVIFDGGYGSEAAKVAKGIYEGYFKDQLTKMNYPFDINTTLPATTGASNTSSNK